MINGKLLETLGFKVIYEKNSMADYVNESTFPPAAALN